MPARANIEALKACKIPVQSTVDGVDSQLLGWGPSAPWNVAYRQALARPGAPFGCLGFFDPKSADPEKCKADPLQGTFTKVLTAAEVRFMKLGQFMAQANGQESVYLWTLQPIYNAKDEVVAAEILLRVQNGQDSAPFEDVVQLCDKNGDEEVKDLYAVWKVAEIKFVLAKLKEHKPLQSLEYVAINLRPADMNPDGPIYKELANFMPSVEERDLVQKLAIEVTEDQEHPENFAVHLKAWKDLGFPLHFDDGIGDLALGAIKKKPSAGMAVSTNFHATTVLMPLLDLFDVVKVDIEWAGFAVFLCHPAFNNEEKKHEVLERARNSDQVTLPPGKPVEGASHRDFVDEFRKVCLQLIEKGIPICLECSVREDDPNCMYVLDMLKRAEEPLDIFGKHAKHFEFQGGLTKAKAFEPGILARHLEEDSRSSLDEVNPGAEGYLSSST
eukprot:TRINITY_DN4080_c0_g1_i10.p1 TRINITY_DN4080_c0_g1~~TRINITY_DN4080_c0_g1_i10.p1  ORF type:complete len:470 (+),score=130.74 TRINITY_DN4080_c0_g1_i10:83-1411(+)